MVSMVCFHVGKSVYTDECADDANNRGHNKRELVDKKIGNLLHVLCKPALNPNKHEGLDCDKDNCEVFSLFYAQI